MLKQTQQLKLLQKLSPQQIQLMKLLQLPTLALEQRIKQEIEENPALEEGRDEETTESDYEEFESENENEAETNDDIDNEVTLEDVEEYFDNDDDVPDYKLHINNIGPDDERKEVPHSSGVSFQDYLVEQLGLKISEDDNYIIGVHIIGSLDDSGYLTRSLDALANDLAFTQNITASPEQIEKVLHEIHQFDPPGVGARNLRECLLLQLERLYENNENNVNISHAIKIISESFNDFTKKHFNKIIKKHNFSESEIKEAYDIILKLNPKPGNTHAGQDKNLHYITPDFTVKNEDGELIITLNSRNAPELRINKNYSEMLKAYAQNKKNSTESQKDAVVFVKQKIDTAKWFIDAIQQRQNTLIYTMEAIMNYQKDFFLTGDFSLMKPMILKDIADKVKLDISTISRVANSKFVETPYGIFSLKSFFSESLQTKNGQEVSTIEVKNILKDCIKKENKRKPLTDDQLCHILKEKGYNIARRTVAKYREQLEIPVARLRKEL